MRPYHEQQILLRISHSAARLGAGSGLRGAGGGGGDVQPGADGVVPFGHHERDAAVGHVLRQNQGAEAVPLRLPQEPQPPPVRQLSQRPQGRLNLRRSVPQQLLNQKIYLFAYLSPPSEEEYRVVINE